MSPLVSPSVQFDPAMRAVVAGRGRRPGSGRYSAILAALCNPSSERYLQPGEASVVDFELTPGDSDAMEKELKAFRYALSCHTCNWLGHPLNSDCRAYILAGEFKIDQHMEFGKAIVRRCGDDEWRESRDRAIRLHQRRMAEGKNIRGKIGGDSETMTPELLQAIAKTPRGVNPQTVLEKMKLKNSAKAVEPAPEEKPAPKKPAAAMAQKSTAAPKKPAPVFGKKKK